MGGKKFNLEKIPEEHDDRSSTEVEDSLLGEDERQWTLEQLHRSNKRPSRMSRVCTTFNSYRWMVDWTLLLLILGFVVRGQFKEPAVNPYDFGGDITGVGPRCKSFTVRKLPHPSLTAIATVSQQIKTFKVDDDYAPWNTSDFFKPEVLDRWNALLPKGMGFQKVDNPEK